MVAKLLKFAVAGGLIYWLVQSGLLDLSKLKLLMHPLGIALAILIAGLNLLVNHGRWVSLLRAQGLKRGFWSTTPLTLIGVFFNFAIPGAVGGDVVKAYYVTQDHPTQRMNAVTTVFMDRVIGLYSMMFLAICALLVDLQVIFSSSLLKTTAVTLIGVFLFASLGLGLAFSSRVKRKNWIESFLNKLPKGQVFVRLYLAVQSYREQPTQIIRAFALSVVAQLIAVGFMVFVGQALGENWIPIKAYIFAVPLGFIVSALPVAPAGIGVGQLAFMFLFRLYTGSETQVGQAGITALQMSYLCWGLLGAYFYTQRKKPVLSEVSQ